jgi:hypothetical protein
VVNRAGVVISSKAWWHTTTSRMPWSYQCGLQSQRVTKSQSFDTASTRSSHNYHQLSPGWERVLTPSPESCVSGNVILRWCAVNNADGDLNIHKMVLLLR